MSEKELKNTRIKIGFLFQGGALYDSMTVRENLEFPMLRQGNHIDSKEMTGKVEEVLNSVGLIDAIDKMPSELSGGMKKRIGLARTLILNPEIILYDEPTTGLDPVTSREISELILKMRNKFDVTSVVVTHDMPCTKLVSDRIVILKEGIFSKQGTYEELEKSGDEFVKGFFENNI
jgi:phospholipid/cholesterol/gamma-HCH transport system ATP-binding protein